MGIQPDLLISCTLRMHPLFSLVLVLPTLVVCQFGDGMTRVEADPSPSTNDNDPGSSSCDPDLLPCTDDDKGGAPCDCPSEEEPRDQRSTSGCQTVKGEQCKFPFFYGGVKYRECTGVDNGGIAWCATTTRRNGNVNLWGNCAAGFSSCTIRYDVMVGTNKLRDGWGRGALKRDAALEENAQKWANFLARGRTCKFYHQSQAALNEIQAAENLAMTMGSPMTGEKAVDMWWKSPGHRRNMMNSDYSRIGVGIASGCRSQGLDASIAVGLLETILSFFWLTPIMSRLYNSHK